MELPDADNQAMKDKMASMGDRGMGEDGYSAIDGLGNEDAAKDSSSNGYSESEMDQIDKDNADRIAQQKAQEEMERSLAESRKHINSYLNSGYSGRYGGGSRRNSGSSRRDELDDYAKELEYIQKRSQAAQRAIDAGSGNYGGYHIAYHTHDVLCRLSYDTRKKQYLCEVSQLKSQIDFPYWWDYYLFM